MLPRSARILAPMHCIAVLLVLAVTTDGAVAQQLFPSPTHTFHLEGGPYKSLTVDVNEDGNDDVIVAMTVPGNVENRNRLAIYISNRDGTFLAPTYSPIPSEGFFTLASGDWNGDGHVDLAVAIPKSTGSNHEISVHLGSGDGTFLSPRTFDTGIYPVDIAAGDFNQDGKDDLVTVNQNGKSVSVLLSRGGEFPIHTEYPIPGYGGAVAVGDMDSDNVPDVIAGSGTDLGASFVTILLSRGDGTFSDGSHVPANPTIYLAMDLVAGDWNGDHAQDIALAFTSSQGSVLLGNGDGTLQPWVPLGLPAETLTAEDINRDGKLDLIGGIYDHLAVKIGNGDGSFADRALRYDYPDNGSHYPGGALYRCLVLGSIDEDDELDAVVLRRMQSALHVIHGNGDGTFGGQPRTAAPGCCSVDGSDLDGDGIADLIADLKGGQPAASGVSVLKGSGGVSFQTAVPYPTHSGGSNSFTLGDWNGDQETDLAVLKHGTSIALLLGQGDGTFLRGTDLQVGTSAVASGDINEDGNEDLVVGGFTLLGRGDGTFETPQAFPVPQVVVSIALGDLNGDDHLDLVLALGNQLLGSQLGVCLGTGNGSFLPIVLYPERGAAAHVNLADLNHDGALDVVWGGAFAADVRLGIGDGTLGPSTFVLSGYPAYSSAIRDFDADGHPDLAFGNEVEVYMLLGNGDGTFRPHMGYGVERGAHALWSGDLDGDGAWDIVARGTNSITVLLNAGQGPVPLQARSFVQGNRPVRVGSGATLCAQVEPLQGAFDASEIDPASMRMVSEGTGTVGSIAGSPAKQARLGDADRNGVPEMSVCFAGADLEALFASVRGRAEIDVRLEGRLVSGAPVEAALRLSVLGSSEASASVSPNPMNPSGILKFRTAAAGTVDIRLFDVSGRLVRTLTRQRMDAGEHAVVIDGHDSHGVPLRSGIYFFRIHAPTQVMDGRLAVVK